MISKHIIKMENHFSYLNTKTKINLALSYENSDIVQKFCTEYSIDNELGKEYFLEVKKFLFLCTCTKEKLAPSQEIYKIWHTFLLFTKEYRLYCIKFLGIFIEHEPEISMEINRISENTLFKTITNYEIFFGPLNNKVWQVNFNEESENEEWNEETDW